MTTTKKPAVKKSAGKKAIVKKTATPVKKSAANKINKSTGANLVKSIANVRNRNIDAIPDILDALADQKGEKEPAEFLKEIIATQTSRNRSDCDFPFGEFLVRITDWGVTRGCEWRNGLWSAFDQCGYGHSLAAITANAPRTIAYQLIDVDSIYIQKHMIPWLLESSKILVWDPRRQGAVRNYRFGISTIWEVIEKGVGVIITPVDWLREGAAKVLDAIKDGVVSVGEVVKYSANWVTDQVIDFASLVVKNGYNLLDYLLEAAKHGIDLFTKWVIAACQEVSGIKDVLISLSFNVPLIGGTIKVLIEIGFTPLTILLDAVKYTVSILGEITKALIDCAKELNKFIAAIAEAGLEVLRAVLKTIVNSSIGILNTLAALATAPIADLLRGKFLQALLDIGHSLFDLLKVIANLPVNFTTTLVAGLICSFGGRPLNDEEKRAARLVFGDWDKIDKVRIAFDNQPINALLKRIDSDYRPFTTLFVINFASRARYSISTVVHELVHVYQNYTEGPCYMVESLEAQLHAKFTGTSAYAIPESMFDENGNNWATLNVEQQAQVIEDYYEIRFERIFSQDEILKIQKYFGYAKKVYHGIFDDYLFDEAQKKSQKELQNEIKNTIDSIVTGKKEQVAIVLHH